MTAPGPQSESARSRCRASAWDSTSGPRRSRGRGLDHTELLLRPSRPASRHATAAHRVPSTEWASPAPESPQPATTAHRGPRRWTTRRAPQAHRHRGPVPTRLRSGNRTVLRVGRPSTTTTNGVPDEDDELHVRRTRARGRNNEVIVGGPKTSSGRWSVPLPLPVRPILVRLPLGVGRHRPAHGCRDDGTCRPVVHFANVRHSCSERKADSDRHAFSARPRRPN